jgi:hypothetical protein
MSTLLQFSHWMTFMARLPLVFACAASRDEAAFIFDWASEVRQSHVGARAHAWHERGTSAPWPTVARYLDQCFPSPT